MTIEFHFDFHMRYLKTFQKLIITYIKIFNFFVLRSLIALTYYFKLFAHNAFCLISHQFIIEIYFNIYSSDLCVQLFMSFQLAFSFSAGHLTMFLRFGGGLTSKPISMQCSSPHLPR